MAHNPKREKFDASKHLQGAFEEPEMEIGLEDLDVDSIKHEDIPRTLKELDAEAVKWGEAISRAVNAGEMLKKNPEIGLISVSVDVGAKVKQDLKDAETRLAKLNEVRKALERRLGEEKAA